MRKSPFTLAVLSTTVLALGGTAVRAVPDVTFFDGGLAEMCSVAAHNTESRTGVTITGSRLPYAPIDVCSMAIRSGESTGERLAGIYNNRGVLYFADGNMEAALEDFNKAMQISDLVPQVHVNRGYTYIVLERWAESLEALNRGIAEGAADPARAHFNRAIAHEELGQIREAYRDYLEAAELDPEWEEPRRELSRFRVGP